MPQGFRKYLLCFHNYKKCNRPIKTKFNRQSTANDQTNNQIETRA